MNITKYDKLTDHAAYNTIRIDYGSSSRIEISYAVLIRKDDRWTSNGAKAKILRLDKNNGVSQLGIYIRRLALVFLKGTVSKGM